MASFVRIEIDTKAPNIGLYAPEFTTRETYNQVTVESDEELDTYQEIYLIDSLGVRHDFVFQRDSNRRYVGLIQLANVPIGLHTLYARMRDEVRNYSNLVSKVIEVRPSSGVRSEDAIYSIVRDAVVVNVKIKSEETNRKVKSEQRKVKVKDIKNEE